MIFNRHSNLAGRHAFLSPSQYHWVNYEDDKLDRMFKLSMAAQRGTELHAFAHEAVRLGVKMEDVPKTLNLYINDAIGYRMSPEQILYYSDNAFGSVDTIMFRKGRLRIHDLKTGQTKSSMHQLEVYVALFCLEYEESPMKIEIDLAIYQHNRIYPHKPDPDVIIHIMDKIKTFDRRITQMRLEAMQ